MLSTPSIPGAYLLDKTGPFSFSAPNRLRSALQQDDTLIFGPSGIDGPLDILRGAEGPFDRFHDACNRANLRVGETCRVPPCVPSTSRNIVARFATSPTNSLGLPAMTPLNGLQQDLVYDE